MTEPTIEDIDALVGPATPHFAFQIRARVREAIAGLPADHPVRRYAEEKLELLDAARASRRQRPRTPSPSRVRGPAGRRSPRPRPRHTRCPTATVSAPARTVFVSGGSRGIGKAIALRLARDGASLIAIGYFRSDAAAEETAEELRRARRGGDSHPGQHHVVPRRASRSPPSARSTSSSTTPRRA